MGEQGYARFRATELERAIQRGRKLERLLAAMPVEGPHHQVPATLREQFWSWAEETVAALRLLFDDKLVATSFRRRIAVAKNSHRSGHRGALTGAIRNTTEWLEELRVGEASQPTDVAPVQQQVFLVHGHDTPRKHEVARFVERVTGFEIVILHEQPNRGRTIIEKFERSASGVAHAIVLLMGDDVGKARSSRGDLSRRARQNVVFELGFFVGSLGRGHVVVLTDAGVEKPSDIDGLVYISLAGDWKAELVRELSSAGMPVDPQRL